ncbi:unnamed protein product, partial [marine sediment metagenome]
IHKPIFLKYKPRKMIRIKQTIWALAVYDYETDIIEFVFNFNKLSKVINHYTLKVRKEDIKFY